MRRPPTCGKAESTHRLKGPGGELCWEKPRECFLPPQSERPSAEEDGLAWRAREGGNLRLRERHRHV
jgi:hypothetical protein